MSAARPKVFGIDLGVEPKFIAIALVFLAILVYYFTSGSDSPGGSSSGSAPAPNIAIPVRPGSGPSFSGRTAAARRNALKADRGPLKLVAVDGSRGDVDPTLRLKLLDRLKAVSPANTSRNLFEAGNADSANLPPVPKNVPNMMPKPQQPTAVADNAPPPAPPFVIPLKYYGFVKPTGQALDGNRGFFMDGDNILVGAEGDLLEKHFLIVALTPNSARLEDVLAKQGQDLPVTPEAQASQ